MIIGVIANTGNSLTLMKDSQASMISDKKETC